MKFNHTTLDNGLRIIAESSDTSRSVAFGFFVRTGARDESPAEFGLSHFLEHMMFKGTASRTAHDVNREFDEMGARYNAFTSHENTVYYGNVLPEFLPRVVDLLSDMLRPSLRQEDFDMEKKVILEEMAMYEDIPQHDLADKALKTHFGDHGLGQPVIGTRESIATVTSEQMHDYFDRRYAAGNVVAVATGAVDFDQLVDLVSARAGQWVARSADRELTPAQASLATDTFVKNSLARQHLVLISPAPSAQADERFAASILANAVGDSTGSRYFWALVEPALADVAAYGYEPLDAAGMFMSYFCCDPSQAPRVLEVARAELSKVVRDGITAEELTRSANKTASAVTLGSEVPMGRFVSLGTNWLYRQEYRSLVADLEAIRSVSLEQVNALARDLSIDRTTTVALGPLEKVV
ncbi:MAG: insulinase family protein [Actinobacteria bacterium]|nr:insulinase family protein [Actinomycetota bacterium]